MSDHRDDPGLDELPERLNVRVTTPDQRGAGTAARSRRTRAGAALAIGAVGFLVAASIVGPRAMPGFADVPDSPTPGLSGSASPLPNESPSLEPSPVEESPSAGVSPSPEPSPSADVSPSDAASPSASPSAEPTPPPAVKPVGTPGPTPNPMYKAGKKLACGPYGGSAVALADGRVLVWGDCDPVSQETMNMPTGWTELFDPGTGIFTPTGSSSISPSAGRGPSMGVVMESGQVFFASGEVYDPSLGRYFPTGIQLSAGTVARLHDGRVLIVAYDDGGHLKTQVYDPGTGKVTPTGPSAVQADTLSATMSDGRVLVLGTLYGSKLAEVYDPASNKFTATASTAVDRGYSSSMTTLHDGKLLIVGAETTGVVEAYNPQTSAFSAVSPMPKPMSMTTCTTLADGRVLVIGTVIGEKQPQYGFAPSSGGAFASTYSRRAWRNFYPTRSSIGRRWVLPCPSAAGSGGHCGNASARCRTVPG